LQDVFISNVLATSTVVWVQRPRTVKQEFEISLQFDVAQNVWGVVLPPADWLPFCKDQRTAVPAVSADVAPEEGAAGQSSEQASATAPADQIEEIETVVYDIASPREDDLRLHEVIEAAVEKSIAHISESAVAKVIDQIAGPLAATIAEKVCREFTDKLDARIEKVMQETVSLQGGTAIESPTKTRTRTRRRPSDASTTVL
jgi:hypothetical protein